MDDILSAIKSIYNWFADIFASLFDGISSTVSSIYTFLGEIFLTLFSGISSTIGSSTIGSSVSLSSDAPPILANNAAISSFSLFTDITLDEWERIFRVNVTGAFIYTREVLPQMINKKRGRIINISSMWGLTGSSCEVHYSATKAAIIGMTKALAKEVGPSGITVNAIAPGVIATAMNKNLSEGI